VPNFSLFDQLALDSPLPLVFRQFIVTLFVHSFLSSLFYSTVLYATRSTSPATAPSGGPFSRPCRPMLPHPLYPRLLYNQHHLHLLPDCHSKNCMIHLSCYRTFLQLLRRVYEPSQKGSCRAAPRRISFPLSFSFPVRTPCFFLTTCCSLLLDRERPTAPPFQLTLVLVPSPFLFPSLLVALGLLGLRAS